MDIKERNDNLMEKDQNRKNILSEQHGTLREDLDQKKEIIMLKKKD